MFNQIIEVCPYCNKDLNSTLYLICPHCGESIVINKILKGDWLKLLKNIPDCSIDCCVTSPPYWGMRNYGVNGQLGLESTFEEYIDKLVSGFREVRRVLKKDGTLWLNMGDSYCSTAPGTFTDGLRHSGIFNKIKENTGIARKVLRAMTPAGLKPKDLVGQPWHVAFALQADGWYLRQDIIWSKPNPMPESVRDRCTKAHEYVFLMSKSAKYYFDAEAIKEDCKGTAHARRKDGKTSPRYGENGIEKRFNNRASTWIETYKAEKVNKRSVWNISTQPFNGAHFATFPEELVEPCILAGCPPGGVVLDPFTGSGTTLLVARKLNRNFIGCEINPDYIDLANRRLRKEIPLFI